MQREKCTLEVPHIVPRSHVTCRSDWHSNQGDVFHGSYVRLHIWDLWTCWDSHERHDFHTSTWLSASSMWPGGDGSCTDAHAAKLSGGLMDFRINILCGDCTFVKISWAMLLTRHILMEFDSNEQLMAHFYNYVINTRRFPGDKEYWSRRATLEVKKPKLPSPLAWAWWWRAPSSWPPEHCGH